MGPLGGLFFLGRSGSGHWGSGGDTEFFLDSFDEVAKLKRAHLLEGVNDLFIG